jgi:hypothetical protein
MKHAIESKGGEVSIRIEELGGRQADVLAALQACSEGRCSCPTPQYGKLDAIDVRPGEGTIDVRLTPKAGETIDLADIEKCLATTTEQANPK